MSIYTINSETELAGGSIADADEIVIYDADAGITKKAQMDSVRQYTSGGVVDITAASDSITAAEHAGRTVTMSRAAGITLTLPAATGTGDKYRFVVNTTVTSNSNIIQVANATDEFVGMVLQVDTDTTDTLAAYPALDGDGYDTITLNGGTTGGLQGDYFEIIDVASGKFLLNGFSNGTGSVATPLSAAVS